jgi:hypothetical protein
MSDANQVKEYLDDLLSRIPTCFGRLSYVAAQRGVGSQLSQLLPNLASDAVARVQRTTHLKLFEQWNRLSLEEQVREIRWYCAGLLYPIETTVHAWLIDPPAQLVPPNLLQTASVTNVFLVEFESALRIIAHTRAAGPVYNCRRSKIRRLFPQLGK